MSTELWAAILDAIPDVDAWNRNLGELKRLAAEHGPECKKFIAAEAESRGYIWHGESKSYLLPWNMKAVQGKRVVGVGWREGQLAVVVATPDGHDRYESVRKDVPVTVAGKILRNPDSAYDEALKTWEMICVFHTAKGASTS